MVPRGGVVPHGGSAWRAVFSGDSAPFTPLELAPRRRKRQPEGKEGQGEEGSQSQSNAAAIGDENGSDWNDAVRWMRADSSE